MEPLPVRDLTMTGRYDEAASRVELEEAQVRLGTGEAPGPTLSFSGVFDHDPQAGGDWEIDVKAKLEDLALSELANYWPETVAPDPRPWIIENVTGGKVRVATAEAQFRIPGGDFAAAQLSGLKGTIDYSGLVAHYLRPLPPVEGITGTATFSQSELRFTATSGSVKSLAIGDSTLEITGLDKVDLKRQIYEQLAIKAKVAGPVTDVLTILEHPRLDLLSKVGLTSEGSGGTLTAELNYQFPLVKDLSLDDLSLQNRATVQGAKLKNVLFGQDLTAGRLALNVDQNGMRISGPLRLGGVPLTVQWKESFLPNPKYRSVLTAVIPEVDDAGRARFGLDIGDVISGPLQAKVTMVSLDKGPTTLQVAADLSRALIDVPEIHWRKVQDTPASLRITIDMDEQGPLAYRDIILQAGDLVARGEARPGPERKGMGWMRFQRVTFGRSDLHNVIVEQSGGGFAVSIGEGVLDAEPFLRKDETSQPDAATEPLQVAQTVSTEETPADPPRTYEPLSVRAPNLDRLYFAESRRLERVNLELVRNQAGWETIRLSGTIPERYWSPRDEESDANAESEGEIQPAQAELDRRYLQFSLAPDASGIGQRLLAKSDDLGALLRATNIVDTVVGGSIQVTGSSNGPSPSHPINAKVVARDFKMVKAPVLAKLLTVASFTGVLDLLSGDGISFAGLDGEFVLDDGVATTELMRVYGAALGLTAKGEIDFNRDAIDLAGTVVPAYSINNFLSNIPLLGTILTGGEGEGLIAVVYKVRGGVDDPEVDINPLSALAPGFLRNIFTAEPSEEGFEAVPERIDR